jgi:chemotaxis protein methyltransferase CheR
MPRAVPTDDVEAIEFRLLLEGVHDRYGLDFRDYAAVSLRRRVAQQCQQEGYRSISALQEAVLHDPQAMDRLLHALTVNVTSMFRDPSFYTSFRQKVVPLLRTYPFIRIWHAGCSTGEEVYSMAILLEEEGIYDNCRIYATDLSEAALAGARSGVFPLSVMRQYTENYVRSGGKRSFSEYYTANFDRALLRPALQRNVLFAQHNLVTDASPNEFNVVLCRNVMIYFNRTLQARVHQLFYNSLVRFGVLALGRKETLRLTPHEADYEDVDGEERIYRKVTW